MRSLTLGMLWSAREKSNPAAVFYKSCYLNYRSVVHLYKYSFEYWFFFCLTLYLILIFNHSILPQIYPCLIGPTVFFLSITLGELCLLLSELSLSSKTKVNRRFSLKKNVKNRYFKEVEYWAYCCEVVTNGVGPLMFKMLP